MGWNPFKSIAKAVSNIADAVVDIVGGVVDAIVDLGSAILGGAITLIGGLFGLDTPSPSTSAGDLRGRTVMVRDPIASRKIVYGQVKNSGAIVFAETTDNNKYLHLCVTLAGHEISNVGVVYFNEDVVATELSDGVEVNGLAPSSVESSLTSASSGGVLGSALNLILDKIVTSLLPDYSKYAKVTAHFGKSDQVADSNLITRTSMTSNHRLRDIAYIYARLEYNAETYENGMPNISAVINGRKVYDPRTGETAYSNNAALCVLDYLRDQRFGLKAYDDEIDFDSFEYAADVCDQLVDVIGGGTEKRYTIDGVVDTSKQPKAILRDLLSACGGSLGYSNGKFKIKVAEYIEPSGSLSMDDVVGSIGISTRVSNQANFNAIKGVFVSPDDNWQPTDFPSITSEVFESEDNGEQSFVDITLPFTTSSAMAQRLAKLMLYNNREQITMNVPCNMKAFKFDVGQTITFTNERFGFVDKVFEVIGWQFSQSNNGVGVTLTLKETSSDAYNWSTLDERELTRNNTTLPAANYVPPVGLTVTDELRSYNEEVITTLIATVSTSNALVDRFEVQAHNGGDWINMGQAAGSRFELLQVQDGSTYIVRARAVTRIGVKSEWHEVAHQVVGKTAPPSDVTGLTGNLIGNQYLLTWNATPDLDLSYYRIRFASADGLMNYENSVSLIPKIARPSTSAIVPARNGTYFVKAVDKLGLASETPATIVLDSNLDAVENLNNVYTIQEHPDFVGTFDDVAEIDELDRLVLNTSILFDSVTGDFDDAEGLFDGGSGAVDTEGFYYFDDTVDHGDVFISRVTSNVEHIRLDYVVLFDSTSGLFDSRAGFFDGDVNAFDDTDCQVQVRTTNDDPTGSPTWSEWSTFAVSDIKARAMQFRAKLTTTDISATPAVSKLSVSIDMPTRVVSEQDITTTAASYSVTFPDGAFKEIPAIGIGAQDLQTGDYYEISSKSASGFIITFKNSGGSAVARSFDYTAKGYGRVIS